MTFYAHNGTIQCITSVEEEAYKIRLVFVLVLISVILLMALSIFSEISWLLLFQTSILVKLK